MFREADWDYSQGIDYTEFLAAFSGKVLGMFWVNSLEWPVVVCLLVPAPDRASS